VKPIQTDKRTIVTLNSINLLYGTSVGAIRKTRRFDDAVAASVEQVRQQNIAASGWYGVQIYLNSIEKI
jgi:hypothetical protein